jgi:sarcosine oxidase subunit beta
VWSDEIAASVGLRLPIHTLVLQMLLSTPGPLGTLTPVIGSMGRALSLKQLPSGAFFIGGGWPGDTTSDRAGATVRPASVEGSWATACAVLPAVAQQRVAHAWCGLEAEPPDEIPIIGPAPNHAGLYLALGFSGHGFAIAPAVGRTVAAELAGHPASELAGLRPSRLSLT